MNKVSLTAKPASPESKKRTPGPWRKENAFEGRLVPHFYIEGENGRTICIFSCGAKSSHGFSGFDEHGEDEANAQYVADCVSACEGSSPSAILNLLQAARCALADLEGIMPEFDPSGDREHPGWQTIEDLRKAIKKTAAQL